MLGQKIDDHEAHRAAVDAGYASLPEYVAAQRPNLAGPFPTLRCREIVKDIVDAVVSTTTHCKITGDQAHWFTLGLLRGARIVAAQDDDETAERFVVEILTRLQAGGVDAVKDLVETVTGQVLQTNDNELTVAKAA